MSFAEHSVEKRKIYYSRWFFREINFFVGSLVKAMLSRDFLSKSCESKFLQFPHCAVKRVSIFRLWLYGNIVNVLHSATSKSDCFVVWSSKDALNTFREKCIVILWIQCPKSKQYFQIYKFGSLHSLHAAKISEF